jgi:hypothetical protein
MTWNHLLYAPATEGPDDALQRCADLAALLGSWAVGAEERGTATFDDTDALAGVNRVAVMLHATLSHLNKTVRPQKETSL